MSGAPALVEHFFRHEYGRAVSALVARFGSARIDLIEDCVQSAMERALASWALKGIPARPGAWIMLAARNNVVDHLRHQGVIERTSHILRVHDEHVAPEATLSGELDDDMLRTLFYCCDAELKARTQLILALKILCGFSVREIAPRLFMSEDAVRKQLTRGKAAFRALGDERDDLDNARMSARLDAVHHVIYLLFNEGYSSTRPDEPIRRELCEEALRLAGILSEHAIATPDTWALLALMRLHHARIDARYSPGGGLLLIEEQARGLWRRDEILDAMRALMRSGASTRPSRYQVEAAILLEHCTARSYEETNWSDIVELYDVLERVNPSPLNLLNRAIALAEWKGAAAGLAELEALTPPTWLARYYLWDATLGELYRRDNQPERARAYLERALAAAPTHAERVRLERRLELCH